MGSTKFHTEHDELARERRLTRTERDFERRLARSRKHTPASPDPGASRPAPWANTTRDEQSVAAEPPEPAGIDEPTAVVPAMSEPAVAPAMPVKVAVRDPAGREASEPRRVSRRELDMARFRERCEQAVREARAEAARRIERNGDLAAVSDALAAIRHPQAAAWTPEREQLEQALTASPRDAAAAARGALRTVSRDAARTTRHAKHDPELAFAVCVAYATVLRLGRTAVRIQQRAHPTPAGLGRPFWH